MSSVRVMILVSAQVMISAACHTSVSGEVFYVARDAWLEGNEAHRNYGNVYQMRMECWNKDQWQAGLIDFNRDVVRQYIEANGGCIQKARLILTQSGTNNSGTIDLWIVRNEFDWNEGSGDTPVPTCRGEVTALAAKHSDLACLPDGYWQVDGIRYSDRWFIDSFKALVMSAGVRHPGSFNMAGVKPDQEKVLDLDPEWVATYLMDPQARGIVLSNPTLQRQDIYTREASKGRFAPRLEVVAGKEGAILRPIESKPATPVRPKIEVPAYAVRTVVFGPAPHFWNHQRAINLWQAVGPWAYQDVGIEDWRGAPNYQDNYRIHVGHLVTHPKDKPAEDHHFYGWWYMDLAGYLADPANVIALGIPGVQKAEDLQVVGASLIAGGFWNAYGSTQVEMYDVASSSNYVDTGEPPAQEEATVEFQRQGHPWAKSELGKLTDLATFAKRENLLMPTARIFSLKGYCQTTFESDGFDFLNGKGLSVVEGWLTRPQANRGFILRGVTPNAYGQIINSDSKTQALPYKALGLQLELAAKKPPVWLDLKQVNLEPDAPPSDLNLQLMLIEMSAFEQGLAAAREKVHAWGLLQREFSLADLLKVHRVLVLLEDPRMVTSNAKRIVSLAQHVIEEDPVAYASYEPQVVGMLLYQGWFLSEEREYSPQADWQLQATRTALEVCKSPARQARLRLMLAGMVLRVNAFDRALSLLEQASKQADPSTARLVVRWKEHVKRLKADAATTSQNKS